MADLPHDLAFWWALWFAGEVDRVVCGGGVVVEGAGVGGVVGVGAGFDDFGFYHVGGWGFPLDAEWVSHKLDAVIWLVCLCRRGGVWVKVVWWCVWWVVGWFFEAVHVFCGGLGQCICIARLVGFVWFSCGAFPFF